jgi:hypothetical protein
VPAEQPPRRISGVFAVQVAEATRQIAQATGVSLLAESTHDSGAVAPAALLDRLQVNGGCEYPDIDIELAALHLPGELGEDFWASAHSIDASATRQLKRAL